METMIIEVQVTDADGNLHTLTCDSTEELTLKDLCKIHEVPLEAVCDGMMLCATCHCYVESHTENLPKMSEMEEAVLSELFTVNASSRLACQISITPEVQGLQIKIASL